MSSAYALSPESALGADEDILGRLAVDLGACTVGGPLSRSETALVASVLAASRPTCTAVLDEARAAILGGSDPLGNRFCELRSPAARRGAGAVYTPTELVQPMVNWTLAQEPGRIVDAGTGSGRFSLRVAHSHRRVEIVAIDSDPLATLMTRGGLAVLGHRNARVMQSDYTRLKLPAFASRTAFLGNPPYLRHHDLPASVKLWAQEAARKLGHAVSGLAGLHAYFFLATAQLGRSGDVGCFVTSAEWLDVNYGAIVRDLLLGGLGGEAIHVLEPTALPFEKTATTAAITCFRIGEQPSSIRFRSVKTLAEVGGLAEGKGRPVARARLVEANRWSPFVRTRQAIPEGFIELGELCRVHRGQVTGSNATWVARAGDVDLPDRVLYPSVTRARELFEAGAHLTQGHQLRRVIDIPEDLDVLDADECKQVERFLRKAKRAGVPKGYIAHHRRAWWAVGLRDPAPILATYMARRPPAFVRNLVEARHLNIAHGLYPRLELPEIALTRLAAELRTSITVAQGRTYAGGLTKFEPREMERLPVPDLVTLTAG